MAKTTCEVRMDGEKIKSEDFVCVVADKEKGAELFYHTDAVTLGMAVQMIAVAYKEELAKLSEEEQKAVKGALIIGGLEDE